MAKRTLVTGGAGFVGHHLVRLLLENGCEVLALDNSSAGKHEHLAALRNHPGFSLTEADLTDEKAVAAAASPFQPDTVFHLAAVHFIPYCTAHPTETINVNVLGTQHVLDAVSNTPSVRKFIFISSAAIYRPQDEANVEDKTPTGAFDIYGLSKIFGEGLIKYYRKICPEVTFINARLFNVYGPGETNPHVLPDILDCIAESRGLSLGNVDPKRDFIYVKDVADALWALAEICTQGTEVNVATGQEYSVRELVDCIAELIGRELKITQDPSKFRKSERMHLVGDIGRLQQLTGWAPRYSLREGLRELLECEGLLERRQPDSPVSAQETM